MIYKVRFLLPKKNLLKKNFDFYFINYIMFEAERRTIQNQNELDHTTESLEQENNTLPILDPVLIDITNQQITQHIKEYSASRSSELYRKNG
jgi:hypothetical protein